MGSIGSRESLSPRVIGRERGRGVSGCRLTPGARVAIPHPTARRPRRYIARLRLPRTLTHGSWWRVARRRGLKANARPSDPLIRPQTALDSDHPESPYFLDLMNLSMSKQRLRSAQAFDAPSTQDRGGAWRRRATGHPTLGQTPDSPGFRSPRILVFLGSDKGCYVNLAVPVIITVRTEGGEAPG